jgi:hypothetical protein
MSQAKPEKIILPESVEAAHFQEGISGWVDRDGKFWGKDERMARWCGCTHVHCKDCGAVISKGYTICDPCVIKRDIDKYKSLEKIDWDGETPLYSHEADVYFFDAQELHDYLAEEEDRTPECLRLVLCTPNRLRKIDEDYFSDDLPEDGELPAEIAGALEVLNKAIREHEPVSWSPSDKAIRTESLGIAAGEIAHG